jgi:hypothetical protein
VIDGRLCKVFSEDGSGALGFEEFLDLFSVFSPQADNAVRLTYVFRAYGKSLELCSPFALHVCLWLVVVLMFFFVFF